jgi:hypothetical protein
MAEAGIPDPIIFTGTVSSIGVEQHGQVEFKNDFLSSLDAFQADGLDYIYDLETQSMNLFYAGFFREADGRDGETTTQMRPFYNAAYRIQKVSFNLPKLTFHHHPFTHVPQMDKHEYDVHLQIDWIEDVYHSIRKYHYDWMNRWYNRAYDVLRCGPQGKFRRMSVIAFHYVNSSDDTAASVIEVPKAQPIFMIDLAGLVPTDIGDMTFDYSNDQNDQLLSIKYECSRAGWFYNKNLANQGNTSLWNPKGSVDGDIQTWKPTGFEADTAGLGQSDVNQNLEQLRIARATTSFMSAENQMG